MVCGKNEEMAANFLFENAFDDEQQNMEAAIAQSMGMAPEQQQQPGAEAGGQP